MTRFNLQFGDIRLLENGNEIMPVAIDSVEIGRLIKWPNSCVILESGELARVLGPEERSNTLRHCLDWQDAKARSRHSWEAMKELERAGRLLDDERYYVKEIGKNLLAESMMRNGGCTSQAAGRALLDIVLTD